MSETTVPAEIMQVHIEHSGPMELATLTDSFAALASWHARFARSVGAAVNGDEVRLYVKEIRSGSIIIELVEWARNAVILVQDVTTVVRFAAMLKQVYDYFTGVADALPDRFERRDARDFVRFMDPVAKDRNGVLHLTARRVNNVIINIDAPSLNANAGQNRATNWEAMSKEPLSGVLEGQVFYWYQARDDAKKEAGDRGMIEAIARYPVRVHFANAEAKRAMLSDALFTKAYVVTVDVQTVDGRPRLYRILAVTETLDRDEDEPVA